ncbi:MAG: glycosyltransferase [Flavobacteriaceae bacterium]|nr:glycosyltransferase [Flavobacteriaceae bacterium]
MDLVKELMIIIELLLLIFLGLSSSYLFFFAIIGLFYKVPIYKRTKVKSRIAILIFDYKNHSKLIQSVRSSVNQDYPLGQFEVFVVSNNYVESNMNTSMFPIRIIKCMGNSKKLSEVFKQALLQIDDAFDLIVTIHSKSILNTNYLSQINLAYIGGARVIQGHRIFKKLSTSKAKYRAITEEMNNHIFRKAHNVIGLSSSILGWGVAYDYALIQDILTRKKNRLKSNSTFKILENEILKRNIKVHYLAHTHFFEYCMQYSYEFRRQQIKWVNSNKKYYKSVLKTLRQFDYKKINKHLIDKFLQLMIPPKLLLFVGVIFGTVLSLTNQFLFLSNVKILMGWLVIIFFNVLTVLFSTPINFFKMRYLNIFKVLPKLTSVLYFTFLNMGKKFNRGPNNRFF